MGAGAASKRVLPGWRMRIRAMREVLGAEPGKPMTQEQFGRFIGVAGGSVARWESVGRVDPWMARKLTRLEQALDLMGELILREDRAKFFEQQHPQLVGLRPIDLLDNDPGSAKVVELLEGMESGAFV